MERKFKDYAIISLKGIAMGAADVVPGVSGGTIAPGSVGGLAGMWEKWFVSHN